jgi:hypothetical protein
METAVGSNETGRKIGYAFLGIASIFPKSNRAGGRTLRETS